MPVHFDATKGRHIIKVSASINGRLVRKTKMMPVGITYDEALELERRMLRAYDAPYADLRQRLSEAAGEDDPGIIYVCMSGNSVAKIGMTRRTHGRGGGMDDYVWRECPRGHGTRDHQWFDYCGLCPECGEVMMDSLNQSSPDDTAPSANHVRDAVRANQ